MDGRPNVLVILNDDMGYSDIGCYGGEAATPNLDNLAAGGLRFTQFYNTARCSPSRASLLTGLHPHQVGVGILTGYFGPEGYEGHLNRNGVTMAEVLGSAGYRTYMSGKWHLTRDDECYDVDSDTWPTKRGFDRFFGTLTGGGNYFSPRTIVKDGKLIQDEVYADQDFYYTDAISDEAVKFIDEHCQEKSGEPFFEYVAYTAPHWPLHAKAEDIEKYKGRFAAGWDKLREERLERLVAMGIIDEKWKLTERDPEVQPWDEVEDKAYQQRLMEVYAAQIDCMDQGIGRIIDCLERNGQLDNTLIFFLSDNGGCSEELGGWLKDYIANSTLGCGTHTADGREIRYGNDASVMPGDETTYQSYGVPWANLSNAPFRMYKHWAHEGGIATPLIVHWPAGLGDAGGELRHQPGQLMDIMATVLDVTGVEYPQEYEGRDVTPLEGNSLKGVFAGEDRDMTLYFEHEGNAAVRRGRWKLVKDYSGLGTGAKWGEEDPDPPSKWELYDMQEDRTELNDIAGSEPAMLQALVTIYELWAQRCGVIPRRKMIEVIKGSGRH